MRVKPFTANSAAAAMDVVREELGDDAIIISVKDDQESGAITVIAAKDQQGLSPEEETDVEEKEHLADLDQGETVRQALQYHGVPTVLISRLVNISQTSNAENPTLALASAIDQTFRFSAFTPNPTLMLVGPSGGGKTITVAKLCAREKLSGRLYRVATTDHRRAGGIEQLEAFTRILDSNLTTLKKSSDLKNYLQGQSFDGSTIIDTPGVNPYSDTDMDYLFELTNNNQVDPILVLPAGLDPLEGAEMARPFADIGVKRMIITRLDVARRAGGVLGAAFGAGIGFTQASLSPNVSEGLVTLNPVSLARIIMPHTDAPEHNNEPVEAST